MIFSMNFSGNLMNLSTVYISVVSDMVTIETIAILMATVFTGSVNNLLNSNNLDPPDLIQFQCATLNM